MNSLHSTTIWVTGTSSGIRRYLAIELAARGAHVILTSRNESALQEVAGIISKSGGTCMVIPGDVQKIEDAKNVVRLVEERYKHPIDILVANAGTHIFTVPEKFDSKEYLDLMDINFGGMLRCIEAVIPSMLARKAGYIVGMANMAGFRGLPTAAAYGASKAAMIHFLDSIRYHLVRHGIQVTVVNPGFVKTPLTDKNTFYMPFLTSPEKAARIIADGMERRKKEICFPFPFNWILKLGRFLPQSIFERIADRLW